MTLTQNSLIWAQKARSEWLINDDRNSRYFHARANERRKRNFIGVLKNSEGEWIFDKERLINMTSQYYRELFSNEEGD